MVCARILPNNIEKCTEKDRVSLRELLDFLREEIEGYDVIILVNDSLAEDLDSTVSSDDRVIVVKENIGG
ncbi:MAG: hypothetical protein QXP68_05810 [Thermosphaera sp.]